MPHFRIDKPSARKCDSKQSKRNTSVKLGESGIFSGRFVLFVVKKEFLLYQFYRRITDSCKSSSFRVIIKGKPKF